MNKVYAGVDSVANKRREREAADELHRGTLIKEDNSVRTTRARNLTVREKKEGETTRMGSGTVG